MTVSAALPSVLLMVRGGAEALRHFQAIVVEIDHDDLGGRIELRREQRGEPDRPGADDRHRRTRRDLAVEHAAFEAGRQDVAQHDQRLFVRAFGNRIKARVGVRDADVLGLRAIDLVAENPAAGRAMRIHAATAVLALAAGRDAGDENAVAGTECGDAGADGIDDADAFMAEDAARCAGRDVAFEDMQVGAADRRLRYLHDRVGRCLYRGFWAVFDAFQPWSAERGIRASLSRTHRSSSARRDTNRRAAPAASSSGFAAATRGSPRPKRGRCPRS